MARTPATAVEEQRLRPSRFVVALVGCVILSACAARAPVVPDDRPERLARAASLVADGCYDCLTEARRIYQSLAGNEPEGAAVALRIFELDLLLALREKELALDATASLDRARTAAQGLPETVGAGRLVQAVELVPADRDGTPFADQPSLGRSSPFEDEADWLAWLAQTPDLSPLVREYLAASIVCSAASLDRRRLAEVSASDTPLLRYRRTICVRPARREGLEQVRTEVEGFAEAAAFEARMAFADLSRTDGSEMRELIGIAYARFPRSPLVLLYAGLRAQTTGDCREAVAWFTETLAVRERHERARLGRAICRTFLDGTFLDEPQGAIADATILIDAGTYNQSDAYYWRAYNRHRLKELEPARRDTALAAGAALDAATAFAVGGERAAALDALGRAAGDPREDRKATVRRLLDDAAEPEHEP